jgi:hypothetical protein
VRQEHGKRLVLAHKAWLEQQLARVSGKATNGSPGSSNALFAASRSS